MPNIHSIESAIDPNNKPLFLLDWELTKLCNLDCSYCPTGPEWGGHDNTTKHPPLDRCLKTIDLMYEYVDVYQTYKKSWLQSVVLNVYGGESLFHPDIDTILREVRNRHKKYSWDLTVTCTTNLIIGKNQLTKIVDLIDEFTVSFHSESLPKQQKQCLDNLLFLKKANKKVKCVIVMHNNSKLWDVCLAAAEFCKINEIPYYTKPLDNPESEWGYNQDQKDYFKVYRLNKTVDKSINRHEELMATSNQTESSGIHSGRSCCAGRCLSTNNNIKESLTFIPKQGFKNWYCTVNWYFMYINQLTETVYNNKDCRVNFNGEIGPLCTLDTMSDYIKHIKEQLEVNTLPTVKCVKTICTCGFCAPKADTIEQLNTIMKKYIVPSITFEYDNRKEK